MEEVKLPIFKIRQKNLKELGIHSEFYCFAFGDSYMKTQYNVVISTKHKEKVNKYAWKTKVFTLPKPFIITKNTKDQLLERKIWLNEQAEELFYNADLFCSAFLPEDTLRITRMIIEEAKNTRPKETLTNTEEKSEKSFIESSKSINDSINNGRD